LEGGAVRRDGEGGLELDRRLAERLARERVRVEVPDADTVLLRRVPTAPRRFNKAATNLLVKRAHPGVPCLVCVDQDLDYLGSDRLLADAFSAAGRQHGWRVLRLSGAAGAEPSAAVERALAALGFGGVEPSFPAPTSVAARDAEPGLLAACAVDLTARARAGSGDPTVGRDEELAALAAALAERGGRLPVVLGGPGAGKTNLLAALARRLVEPRPRARLLAVDAGVLFSGSLFEADRENALTALLAEAAREPDAILAVERIERLLAATTHGAFQLTRALDDGRALVGTAPREARARLAASPLGGRLVLVELPESGAVHARAVLAALAPRLAAHHAVTIDEALYDAAIARAGELAGELPGTAVALLDAAAARAAVAGAGAVEIAHLHLAAARLAAREA
jgi:ATP-dependent Clp protease ATP-binding subunit ClpA